jgi:hypothetical protein
MHVINIKHFFSFQNCFIFILYFNKLCSDLEYEKMEDPIFIYNYCQKNYCSKQLNMVLREHVTK